MRSLTFIIVAVSAVWPATSAQARDVRRLQPSSKWVVNYADDSCSLGRSFGEGDRKVMLFLEQFVPGDTFNMMLVGKSVDLRSRRTKASVRFGPNEEESEETGVAATTNNTPAIILHGHQRLAPLTDAEKSAAKAAVDRKYAVRSTTDRSGTRESCNVARARKDPAVQPRARNRSDGRGTCGPA